MVPGRRSERGVMNKRINKRPQRTGLRRNPSLGEHKAFPCMAFYALLFSTLLRINQMTY